jgi:hypothetical protein
MIFDYFGKIDLYLQKAEQFTPLEFIQYWFIRKPIIGMFTSNIPPKEKSNFDFRLETPDQFGTAGIHKIGFVRIRRLYTISFQCFALDYLQNLLKPNTRFFFPIASCGRSDSTTLWMTDLTQLICAYRLWNEDLEISISTRENENSEIIFRLVQTGMSAGSQNQSRWLCNRSLNL